MSKLCENHGPYSGAICDVCEEFRIEKLAKAAITEKRYQVGPITPVGKLQPFTEPKRPIPAIKELGLFPKGLQERNEPAVKESSRDLFNEVEQILKAYATDKGLLPGKLDTIMGVDYAAEGARDQTALVTYAKNDAKITQRLYEKMYPEDMKAAYPELEEFYKRLQREFPEAKISQLTHDCLTIDIKEEDRWRAMSMFADFQAQRSRSFREAAKPAYFGFQQTPMAEKPKLPALPPGAEKLTALELEDLFHFFQHIPQTTSLEVLAEKHRAETKRDRLDRFWRGDQIRRPSSLPPREETDAIAAPPGVQPPLTSRNRKVWFWSAKLGIPKPLAQMEAYDFSVNIDCTSDELEGRLARNETMHGDAQLSSALYELETHLRRQREPIAMRAVVAAENGPLTRETATQLRAWFRTAFRWGPKVPRHLRY